VATHFTSLCLITFSVYFAVHCGRQNNSEPSASSPKSLPPIGQPSDAPEFIRSLSLLYPQAEIYRVDSRIIQKTNHGLSDITTYYEKILTKHGFEKTSRLEQTNGALMQYERSLAASKAQKPCKPAETYPGTDPKCAVGEMVSIDISRLPYAENYLIRIGRSEVDYNRGQER
jgi:hypothetical protein